MIFVIYGEESFLMEQKLQVLKKEYNCSEEMMNLSIYRGDEDSMESVYEDLITPPFFTDKKMIVLKNLYFLTTKKLKKDNSEIEYFEKCLDNDSKEVIFVIYHVGKDFDERKKIVKRLRKEAKFFEIDKVNHYKLSDSTRQAVKRRNAVIDDDALELLLSRLGDSLNNVVMEVEKLCLYDKHITYETVDKLVSKPLDENVFALTSAILQRNRQKMFSI